ECLSPSAQSPMITPQKFIAELRMLRTRAKELGLPITANMIGRAIEVCEVERDGDLLTVRRIEELVVGTHSIGQEHSIAREGRNDKSRSSVRPVRTARIRRR